jgi:Fatty acid/phospholipid biosynthesis enzyme
MIAVDAMGGDHAPHAIIQGSILAAQHGIPILLCGDEIIITNHLNVMYHAWQSLPITIQACSQIISMEDEPAIAVKTKQDSSLVVAMRSVVQGKSHACVSAGNSGAVLVASILYSGRLEGVSRPAVAGFLPTKKNPVLCLDLGANVDCKNEYLYQFARMGSAYMMSIGKSAYPRVALLSNGHEPYKGSLEVKKHMIFCVTVILILWAILRRAIYLKVMRMWW